MRQGTRIGQSSIYAGTFAILFAFMARNFELWSSSGKGLVLRWLDNAGWVNVPASSYPKIGPIGFFSMDDQIAVSLLYGVAVSLAACCLLLSFLAETRREATLYLSAGFICGVEALHLVSPLAAMATLILGSVLVAWCRTRQSA